MIPGSLCVSCPNIVREKVSCFCHLTHESGRFVSITGSNGSGTGETYRISSASDNISISIHITEGDTLHVTRVKRSLSVYEETIEQFYGCNAETLISPRRVNLGHVA